MHIARGPGTREPPKVGAYTNSNWTHNVPVRIDPSKTHTAASHNRLIRISPCRDHNKDNHRTIVRANTEFTKYLSCPQGVLGGRAMESRPPPPSRPSVANGGGCGCRPVAGARQQPLCGSGGRAGPASRYPTPPARKNAPDWRRWQESIHPAIVEQSSTQNTNQPPARVWWKNGIPLIPSGMTDNHIISSTPSASHAPRPVGENAILHP
eukprot:gene24975-biopygen23951